jgi:8-amino-7-oxononanoate synthase
MSAGEWEQAVRAVLAELNETHLYRQRRLITPLDATHVVWQNRQYVNFASNNYLGLTHHPKVLHAAEKSFHQEGGGAGASPLTCGYGPTHAAAEQHIARWKGTESCVLLPSGYQANHAAVQTLASGAQESGKRIRFLMDKLCHASLIDAVRATGLPFRVFPHNNLEKLKRLLEIGETGDVQVVVSESIFSMDGDAADLVGLGRLKSQRPFVLLLDEAHATGVYGPFGSGLTAELDLRDVADVVVITLSKSIGCAGGAVCGSGTFCEALVNFARAYLYSTNMPAAIAAAADAAVSVMEEEPARQARVRDLAAYVRKELNNTGFNIPAGNSPIVPIIIGSEVAALEAAEKLMTDGLLVLAIRPPTVPRGTCRLRVSLSSEHRDAEIEQLIRSIHALEPAQSR